tara:strand:- start:793 stop:936 length:144 start_codon:yes stop_codon:yes gene_type:complete
MIFLIGSSQRHLLEFRNEVLLRKLLLSKNELKNKNKKIEKTIKKIEK